MIRAKICLPQKSLPLTALEEFLWRCETPSTPMVIRVLLRFSGDCDTDSLVSCIPEALERHPMMLCSLNVSRAGMVWNAAQATHADVSLKRTVQSGSVMGTVTDRFDPGLNLQTSSALRLEIQKFDDGILLQLTATDFGNSSLTGCICITVVGPGKRSGCRRWSRNDCWNDTGFHCRKMSRQRVCAKPFGTFW
jgi:hypothetical protein